MASKFAFVFVLKMFSHLLFVRKLSSVIEKLDDNEPVTVLIMGKTLKDQF